MTADHSSQSRRWPVHPMVFGVYHVVLLWGVNVAVVGWWEGLVLCVVAIASAAVIQLLCTAILRERQAGAVLASLVVMIAFAYGRVYAEFIGTTLGGVQIGRHLFLLAACAVLVVIVGLVLLRPRRSPATATGALTIVALCLLTLATIPMVRHVVAHVMSPSAEQPEVKRSRTAESHERPDIYYIIADSYCAASTLEAVYGFSNKSFLQALRDRGFFVAGESRANYVQTDLSLTSSLNMDYLLSRRPWFAPAAPLGPDRERQFRSMAVVRFARRLGYAAVNLMPLNRFAGVEWPGAGRFRPLLEWNSLTEELVNASILGDIAARFILRDVRERFLGTVRMLLAVRDHPGPKFVYVHLLPPHAPFVFTASGARVPPGQTGRAAYIDQLRFVNATLLAVIDSLRAGSTSDPIIILQGDHGTSSEGGSFAAPSLALVRERTLILNAYRVPRRECRFYHTVTPVNSFRIIFNCVFNANLALLPDSSFFSSYDRPYEFRNVTALVRGGDSAAAAGHATTAASAGRQ